MNGATPRVATLTRFAQCKVAKHAPCQTFSQARRVHMQHADASSAGVVSRSEGAPVVLLNVLESLQVQAKNGRQNFNLEALLRLLQPRTGIAKEFVLRI